MTKLDFHHFHVRHFNNVFEQSWCHCRVGATPVSRSNCLQTCRIHHQVKYRRKNANTCIEAAILFSGHPYIGRHYRATLICMCVCVCVCVWRQKTRLFAVLPLENRHEIALYRSASQFIFFERCLESRTSLLSSAMAMGSNSCTAPRGIEHYGNWVCRPTTSLRERWRADRLAHGQ